MTESLRNDEGGVRQRLRRLPSVDALLQTQLGRQLVAEYRAEATVERLRAVLEDARRDILAGEDCPSQEAILGRAAESLASWVAPTLVPVINATGVIIHTNLGRAPLSRAAREAMEAVATGYSNLEYDLAAGTRGSRHLHAESLLCQLTGAEAALVVNNNAASVLLMLAALGRAREVIISRGQLVEIGGGFRIPEVMHQSGAHLVEVGTTNRTYLHDYEAAIGETTVALMQVHRSNFALTGFTHEPSLQDLASLAHEHGLLMFDDLGSGALLDTSEFGLAREPTIQDSIAGGSDLVCASGDKLLGGPQAGIILGRRELIERLKRFPLLRALRVDKTTLASLEATLRAYLTGRAAAEIPVWQMIAAPLEELEARASGWAGELRRDGIETMVVVAESTVGGGSLPGQTLPTRALALRVPSANGLAARLRASTPPVIVRINEGLVLLDPRTVLPTLREAPEQEQRLLVALREALTAETLPVGDSSTGLPTRTVCSSQEASSE
jgi:L-seryl-tRNA(Ser) seleniumtransferase